MFEKEYSRNKNSNGNASVKTSHLECNIKYEDMKSNKNARRIFDNRTREELERKRKMTDKPLIWPEEVCKMFSERKLEIRADGEKITIITKNLTLIEEAVTHVKKKGF